jgi:hypothetical protein
MGDVIDFKTREKNKLNTVDHRTFLECLDEFHPNNSLTTEVFLLECALVLEEDDYRDVLCGILDKVIYDTLEPELQDIVKTYLSILN